MRAEQGRTYAQIVGGKCHWIFTAAELPEWNNDQVPAVDVTGNVPSVGDLWDGAVFSSPPPPPPVVLTCTPWQMRKALNNLGLRAAVESYVATADQTTKDGWEFATEFREDDAFVTAAQAALGMTDADRTNLFQLAVTL